MQVAEMITESTSKNINNENKKAILNETVPSKNQTIYVITPYHTTNMALIQEKKSKWVNKDFWNLKAVPSHKQQNTSMTDSYNKTLEIPPSTTPNPLNQQSKSTLSNTKDRKTDSPETSFQINQ